MCCGANGRRLTRRPERQQECINNMQLENEARLQLEERDARTALVASGGLERLEALRLVGSACAVHVGQYQHMARPEGKLGCSVAEPSTLLGSERRECPSRRILAGTPCEIEVLIVCVSPGGGCVRNTCG